MTRTGRTLTEYMEMGAAGKVALLSFINYLPPESALRVEQDPKNEYAAWDTTAKTNAILADLFDLTVAAHSKKGTRPPKYPRPKDKKSIGKDAVSIGGFWDWWCSKEKKHGRRNRSRKGVRHHNTKVGRDVE